MRVVLIGADFEENLGMCAIAAAIESAGHSVSVVPFNARPQLEEIVSGIVAQPPDVVGLAMQFQHRAFDFLALARALRSRGYRGHITCGGQFPTLAFRETLGDGHGVDSVVLHEGESTIVALLTALGEGHPLEDVPGLALPGPLGPRRTAPRPLERDLDALPVARRYRPHALHLEVPFIPISGGRGCWGSCSYCSITTASRDARAYGGGQTLRLRSPENVAAEMAVLYHQANAGAAIFCFHDDNFILPRASDAIARVRAMREALDAFGVGPVALVGKARPDCLSEELLRELRSLGLMRLYIGVENVSDRGSESLNRRKQTAAVRQALAAARSASIFACYNLLLFEPDTTLDDVRENVAFIREHPMHPINFCRAEPYYGTPLHQRLEESKSISGSYLGYDYRLEDDRAELLFRVCSTAFRERNFAAQGVGNRYMGLGYSAQILAHFQRGDARRRAALLRRADQITRGIARETAEFLSDAIALADKVDLRDHDRVERETALLGLRIGAADAGWHLAMDNLHADMRELSRTVVPTPAEPPVRTPNRRLLQALSGLAFASTVGWVSGCGGQVDVPPPTDATPPKDSVPDMVVDCVPVDSGIDSGTVVDMPPPDTGVDGMVVDAVPIDTGVDASVGALEPSAGEQDPRPFDSWQDTTPKRSCRTSDLALSVPPSVSLEARRDGERVHVRIVGSAEPMSVRWQSQGMVEGDGREIAWIPGSHDDLLAVAVRTRNGVAVLGLRARLVAS